MIAWLLLVVALLVVGMVLAAIEVFTPGFGVPGAIGGALCLAGIALAFTKLGQFEGFVAVAVSLAAAGAMAWYIPRSKAAKQLVLTHVQTSNAVDPKLQDLLGQRGVSLTPLRPAGTVKLPHRLIDVVTDGRFVESGTHVRVSHVEGGRIVVEPVADYSGDQNA